MPQSSQKRKLRSDPSTSQEENVISSPSVHENRCLSEGDCEGFSNEIENRISKRLRDTEFGQRQILRLTENLSCKVDRLSNTLSEQRCPAVRLESEEVPSEELE